MVFANFIMSMLSFMALFVGGCTHTNVFWVGLGGFIASSIPLIIHIVREDLNVGKQ